MSTAVRRCGGAAGTGADSKTDEAYSLNMPAGNIEDLNPNRNAGEEIPSDPTEPIDVG